MAWEDWSGPTWFAAFGELAYFSFGELECFSFGELAYFSFGELEPERIDRRQRTRGWSGWQVSSRGLLVGGERTGFVLSNCGRSFLVPLHLFIAFLSFVIGKDTARGSIGIPGLPNAVALAIEPVTLRTLVVVGVPCQPFSVGLVFSPFSLGSKCPIGPPTLT